MEYNINVDYVSAGGTRVPTMYERVEVSSVIFAILLISSGFSNHYILKTSLSIPTLKDNLMISNEGNW